MAQERRGGGECASRGGVRPRGHAPKPEFRPRNGRTFPGGAGSDARRGPSRRALVGGARPCRHAPRPAPRKRPRIVKRLPRSRNGGGGSDARWLRHAPESWPRPLALPGFLRWQAEGRSPAATGPRPYTGPAPSHWALSRAYGSWVGAGPWPGARPQAVANSTPSPPTWKSSSWWE